MKACKLLVLSLLVSSTSLLAQTVNTAIVEYNGLKYPAYVKEVNTGVDQATQAVKDYFASRGARGKDHKGFIIYRNVMMPTGGGSELLDVFVRVERAGKKNEDKAQVMAILTKPGTISEEKPTKEQRAVGSGVVLAAGGHQFYEELTPAVNQQAFLKNIADQEAEIKKAEKKLSEMESDKAKMEKQIEKLKSDIANLTKAIADQAAEVNRAKGVLETTKSMGPGNQ
jgi:hypothetical protein